MPTILPVVQTCLRLETLVDAFNGPVTIMKQRVYWIDYLKAFTIFMVVLGHMLSCDAIASTAGKWIYLNLIIPFHMPVFAVLSGCFFSAKDNFPTFLKKKTLGIVVPYLIWGALWFFCKPLICLFAMGQEIHLSTLIWQLWFLLYDGYCLYGWWFLRALFLCFLTAYLSVKVCKSKMLLDGLGSCLILYILMWTGIVPNMPEKDSALKGFFYLYPFFWTGIAFRNKEKWMDDHRWLLPVSAVVFVVMLFLWKETDSFYAMNTSALETTGANDIVGLSVVWKTVWRYFVGAIGSLSFVLCFKWYLAEGRFPLVMCIGQETLGIYILQSLVYWSLPSSPIFPAWGNWGNFALAWVVSILIVLVSYGIVHFTTRNRYAGLLLWGKRILV